MDDRRSTDVQIEVLTERVENWMATTTEYRKSLCAKLDHINERMNNLPCKERIENTKSVHMQLKALWVLVSAAFLGVLSEWIKLK